MARSVKKSAKKSMKRSMKRSTKRKSMKRSMKKRSVKKSMKKRSVKRYSAKSCPRGSISRKSYTRKNGTKVKSACVKSKGLRFKGMKPTIILPKLREGSLKKYGYAVHEPKSDREEALKKAYKAYGLSETVKKLNAVRVLSRNIAPKNSAIYAEDIKFVEGLRGGKAAW